MKSLKQLESELAQEWQNMQLMESTVAKILAQKAYNLKYALYRKARIWQQMLLEPVTIKVV